MIRVRDVKIIEYYHIVTNDYIHDLIYANGLPVETLTFDFNIKHNKYEIPVKSNVG